MTAPRLLRTMDQPLLRIGSHPVIGQNINGPCVLRVPSWVPDRKGRFYMYFAHHAGRSIRMAVADNVMGPWQVLDTPPLHLADTGFAQADVTHSLTGAKITEPAHIASPDVHIVDEQRQFVMFFHGLHADGRQCTRIAVSDDGLHFSTRGFDHDVAPLYLRVCAAAGRYFGVTWGGELFGADTLLGPYTQGPPLLERPNGPDLIPRHPMLAWKNGLLHCFYSLIGDCPERLWHVCMDPSGPMDRWRLSPPAMLLAPELPWEGAAVPQAPSTMGITLDLEHALRDPFLFEDHLFYVAGGEQAIAAVQVAWR